MKTMTATAGILLLVSATMAPASTETLVFGDSLSDGGAAQAATLGAGGTWPSEVYPNGQFTDGDTWATKIGSTFASGYNFAFGGARAVENGDASPDFAAQRESFFGSGLDASTVSQVAIWFGGNDFRDLLSAGVPTPAGVAAASATIIGEIVTGIGELSSKGLTDYVVFGMPDLSRIPAVVNEPIAGTVREAVDGYNAALQSSLGSLAGATGLNIDFLDIVGITDAAFADAAGLGFTNLTEACIANAAECAANPGQFFFCDDIHPTDGVHSVVAAAFEDVTAVVPLPAGIPLILSAFTLLGLTSRRHKSRA